ncbi:MAG: putative S-layer protein [Nanoarchaeota archaeon]|nr:putative S-layer protein [Nanoarchaeota archaeon]
MKTVLISIVILLLLAITVTASDLNIQENNLNLTLEPGDLKTLTFTIKNEGTTDLTGIQFTHNIKLTDNDDDHIILSFSNPGTITPGQSPTIDLTIDADNLIDFNTYAGTITATSSNGASDTLPLHITIEPIVCDAGIKGNDLTLTIEKPDNNDDFKPGETITIKTNVENNGSHDIDVRLEAFLFGDEDEIRGAAAKVMNIDNGDDDDFTFTLEIPVDSRKIESDKSYSLVIKAFDDDAEEDECTQQAVTIKLELDDHDVIFDNQETRFEPAATTCGEQVTAALTAINIGDKEQDAYFTLTNQALHINQKTSTFPIDNFDSDENHIATRRIPVTIPATTPAGTYTFQAGLHYRGTTKTKELPLIISSCGEEPMLIPPGKEPLHINQNTYTILRGETITLPVTITNLATTPQLYNIELLNTEDYATTQPQLLTLGAGQTITAFLPIMIHDDALLTRHSGNIILQTQGTTIASEDVYFDIQQQRSPTFFDSLFNAPLWFIILVGSAIIILLVLLIWALTRP